MFGSLLAFGGCALKATYSVTFRPPEGSRYSHIDLLHLPAFRAGASDPTLPGTQLLSFNAFNGPLDIRVAVFAVMFMFAVGFLASLTSKIDIAQARSGLSRILAFSGHSVSAIAAVVGVGTLIWAFRDGRQPAAIRHAFVSDLGGSSFALHASRYLSAQVELGAFVLLAGLVMSLVATYSTKGSRAVAFIVMALLVSILVEAGR